MTDKEKNNKPGAISRREFLKDAGLLVGGTAIGSSVLLAACGDGETVTEKVTTTVTGAETTTTKTVTSTAAGETVTTTATQQVSKFVCPIDGMEFDTLEELQAHFKAEHGGESATALNIITLNVNGIECKLQCEPTETLQDLLRNKLGLKSPKDMCFGWGACGSCSVILDGRPILSCMALAGELDGSTVETAEGIADAGHPIIGAFNEAYAIQCGYCTPGFVVTAKALLDHDANPSEEKIREALSGNLCRCGTYPRMAVAVELAAQRMGGE